MVEEQPPRKATVLLVDDEPDICQVLRLLLESEMEDVSVATAASGEEALRALRDGNVDLLVTDYRMPGMDGLELLRRVRKDNADLPAVMISAYADPEIGRIATEELGALAFVRKPFHLDGWVDIVRDALERRIPSDP